MPPRILLIVYIHGFKGSADTFAAFPSHLTALLSHRLPHLSIRHLIFPTFETRGDLVLTVHKFRSWLEEQVIDLEVELGTASPTVDPGVGVVICGHSMGGIVGVEACLGLAGERVLNHGRGGDDGGDASAADMAQGAQTASEGQERMAPTPLEGEKTTLLFPYVHGMLAFDTPYLGISPGVVAHGAEGHWKEGKAWYDNAMGVMGALGVGTVAKEAESKAPKPTAGKALPSPEADGATVGSTQEKEPPRTWAAKWGRTALIASAGLAATATLGTTAYLHRENITSSFSWVSSHLEFVGCLARGEELRQRVDKMIAVSNERQMGFANLYTLLAEEKGGGRDGRTFCNLPKPESRLRAPFRSTRNVKVEDEVNAHMYMFVPKENPGYYGMSEQTLELIVSWVDRDSVQSASEQMSAK